MKNQLNTPNNLTFVSDNQQLNTAFEKIKQSTFAHDVLNGINAMVAIINEENNFVFANDLFLKTFQFNRTEDVIGRKIGEILKCIYYDQNIGCGGKKICTSCELSIILNKNVDDIAEEHVTATILAKSVDLTTEKYYEISYNGLALAGDKFKMLTIIDVSVIKRKERFEAVYLKRMDKQLAIVKEQSDLVRLRAKIVNSNQIELYELLDDTIIQLKEKTSFQQFFLEAQNETLYVVNEKLSSVELYNKLTKNFLGRCSKKGIVIKKGLEFDDFNFYSDRNILESAFVTLIENALESSLLNSEIVISMSRVKDSVVFSVHNDAVMSDYVQLQVFRNMKGIGTYGVKLFIEKYLSGRVYFTSGEGLGTTFYLKLPLVMIC